MRKIRQDAAAAKVGAAEASAATKDATVPAAEADAAWGFSSKMLLLAAGVAGVAYGLQRWKASMPAVRLAPCQRACREATSGCGGLTKKTYLPR